MENQFIPYGQALELKQLGFNENYIAYYTNDGKLHQGEMWKDKDSIKAPLYQQAFRWFRDQYGYTYSIGRTNICVYHLMVQGTLLTNMIQDSKSYEEAELKCIQAFIDAAKQIKNTAI